MSKDAYFSLQHSESVVAQMAATLLAAYIRNGEVNDGNENEYIQRATRLALKMADYTDQLVKSDEEWVPQDKNSALL